MRALAIAVVVGFAARASADPPGPSVTSEPTEASAMFQQGRELVKLGRHDEACRLFARSYELEPALGTAVNLADCLERQGQLRRAWQLFDLVAQKSQNVQSRARFARERADALRGKLATVVVTLHEPDEAGLSVRIGDHDVRPAAEIRELIDPRDVDIVATVPGRLEFKTTVHAVAGETSTVDIPAFATPRDEPVTRRRRSRVILAGALGGAGVAGLGASLGLAIAAKRTYDGAFDEDCMHAMAGVVCTGNGKVTIDRAGARADLATGFVIGGALLVAAGAAVYFTAPREVVQVAPVAARDALGIGISGRF